MKRAILLAAASALGASIFLAAPATAQVQLGIGPDGPTVRVGPSDEDRYERRRSWRQRQEVERSRAYEEGRRDAWRDNRGYSNRCRTVIIREEDEWGRGIERRVQRC